MMSGEPNTRVESPPLPMRCQSGATMGGDLRRHLKKPTKYMHHCLGRFNSFMNMFAGLSDCRHPNILQLYGICHSKHFTALVFHNAPSLMYRGEYYKTLPSSQWISHYLKLHQQHESAHSMLEAHNLRGWALRTSDVDETGKLVIAHFIPGPTDHSALDPWIWMAFETNTFIKEDLLDYYKFLFDMIAWSTYPHTFILLSPFEKGCPISTFSS
ncbi:hypothetical protein C8J56DRAFT_81355 [Mycena floridula]|nr:hypothetical protein C8J56DRAFT_81355 [Mycena floridula]